jgi:putative transposase
LNGLKKNSRLTHQERLSLIDKNNLKLSIKRQSELLGISRSSIYYKPKGFSKEDITTMNAIDKIYTKYPFMGARRIKAFLLNKFKIKAGRERINRLMKLMGIEAIYPKPKLSIAKKENFKFPYLLKNLKINKAGQVSGTDITYIRLRQGFIYLVAIMDWFSRYVLSWRISTSLDSRFCIDCLKEALKKSIWEINNSDQGVQFTNKEYIEILKSKNIKISMDARGRCFDNIFTERLWRSVKYEDIYLKGYQTVKEAKKGLKEYFEFYNNQRPHKNLNYRTPAEIYFQ